ncbi:MAG: SagB family peptide dehydrogenase [Desulfosarcina sp.]
MIQRISTAAEYHRATSYRRQRLPGHTLDWMHSPSATKPYPPLKRVPLERDHRLPEIDFFERAGRGPTGDQRSANLLDRHRLSKLFRLTHDMTARRMQGGDAFYLRSVASAGALYPFELYLAAHRIDGLDPGVYHHGLFDFSLTVLRSDPLAIIPPTQVGVAATVYIAGIFFRSAWKYRGRAYRYVLLDAGHLLENLHLALDALNFSFSIHLDFDDSRAAALLGLDARQEVCLACVHLYDGSNVRGRTEDAGGPAPLRAEILKASTVSDRVVVYPEILAVHRAGNRVFARSAEDAPDTDLFADRPTAWIDLDPPATYPRADYVQVLRQRRSRRNFVAAPVSLDRFTIFMDRIAQRKELRPAMPRSCRLAVTCGFLVGEKMPIPPGFYVLDACARRLGVLKAGHLTASMAAACLDQMWLKQAALHMLLLTDLAALDRAWGARGYRYALIEAGRLGQQAYLAATAVGWGACGIGAVYDREAADLLGLKEAALLYLVGIGPVKA